MKFENYVICQYLMISYVKDVVKFLMSFENLSCTMLTSWNIPV
jgi:hypothetical protein